MKKTLAVFTAALFLVPFSVSAQTSTPVSQAQILQLIATLTQEVQSLEVQLAAQTQTVPVPSIQTQPVAMSNSSEIAYSNALNAEQVFNNQYACTSSNTFKSLQGAQAIQQAANAQICAGQWPYIVGSVVSTEIQKDLSEEQAGTDTSSPAQDCASQESAAQQNIANLQNAYSQITEGIGSQPVLAQIAEAESANLSAIYNAQVEGLEGAYQAIQSTCNFSAQTQSNDQSDTVAVSTNTTPARVATYESYDATTHLFTQHYSDGTSEVLPTTNSQCSYNGGDSYLDNCSSAYTMPQVY